MHDQTEALTFADEVVVMQEGEIVQIGTPVELFEKPAHTFVGHFIGSPGMNVLPCELREGAATFEGRPVPVATDIGQVDRSAKLEIGVRPEFVHFANGHDTEGLPVNIVKIADVGRHRVVEARSATSRIYALLEEDQPAPEGEAHLVFDPGHTRVYADGWLAPDKAGA